MAALHLRARAGLVAAGRRGRRRWQDPAERSRARLAMDAVAGPSPGVDRLARAHLARHEQREWCIGRPAALTRMPAIGAGNLRDAHARGRGVIVSFCHVGMFPGVGITVAECTGAPVHPVAGAWLAAPPTAETPPRAAGWRAAYASAGITVVDAAGSFQRLHADLARAEIVTMAFDWPGDTVTVFLGRPVAMATGTARLAHRTGALIVPVYRSLRRWRPVSRFAEPLDPASHDGWEPLHRALAAVHERWIAADPAALEDPRRPGCWGAEATAAGWGALAAGTGAGAPTAR